MDLGVGEFHHVVVGLHRRLCDFIHSVVVHRRDDAIRGWRNWVREDPLIYKWLRPDLVPPVLFFNVTPIFRLAVLGCWLTLLGLMRNSERLGFPTFVVVGKGRPALRNSIGRLGRWLPLLPEVSLPRLTGQMLADVVQRKDATAGSLDGWGWREMKGPACFLV